MALRQQQELKQTQRLSPLQMQVIKLVELNSVELEDKIKQELEDNPALDEGSEEYDLNKEELMDENNSLTQEEIALGDYMTEDDIPDYQINRYQKRDEPDFIEATFAGDKSLNDFLNEQISLH